MVAKATLNGSITVLVVDDETLARRNLTLLLERDPEIARVDECESGRAAIECIRRLRPDLLFLDIQMPECDGFDVLEILGSEAPSTIIFVTAHDDYALRAFEAGALDYLLKPFDDGRFERALTRAKDKLAHYARPASRSLERLVIKSRGKVVFVDVASIDWVEAADYYACLHAGEESYLLRRTLAELERDLGSETFIRIHRSIIVRLERISGLELRDDGEYDVVLKSKRRLRLSRGYRKRVQERIEITAKSVWG
ncbi:MAG: LytTR family DNA-binding domain-containing protein [Burkholderiaceae bacterium]|jgi:two-component system LytT family response regulator